MTHTRPLVRPDDLLQPAVLEIATFMRRMAGLERLDATRLVRHLHQHGRDGAASGAAGASRAADLEAELAANIHAALLTPAVLADVMEDPEWFYASVLEVWPDASDAAITRAMQTASELVDADAGWVREAFIKPAAGGQQHEET